MSNNNIKSFKYLYVRISKEFPSDICSSFDDYDVSEEAEAGDRMLEYELFINTESGEVGAKIVKDYIYGDV